MKAPTTRSKPAQRRRALRRRLGRGGGCVWCSCGYLPTEHAQRVRLDFFFVLDYRQPIGIFVHRPIAGRALPDDLQASILDFEAPAQIGAGNSNIAVRDIAFRAGRACGASSNGSAKTVPVWLSCGLHAGCATEGGAHAACSRGVRRTCHSTSGRRSSQRTAPLVARSIAGQCSAGIPPRAIQFDTADGVTLTAQARALFDPRISAAFASASMPTALVRRALMRQPSVCRQAWTLSACCW